MAMVDRWNVLGRRLDGLLTIHDRFSQLPPNAVSGSQEKALLRSAVGLARDYLDFHTSLTSLSIVSLPVSDQARLAELVAGALDDSVSRQRAAHLAELVLLLSLLRSDVDAVMSDGQVEIHSRAERAFLHLQWSIAANEAVRNAWIGAYDTDEPTCEALGAAHLLLHGIFAFKASSPSARTDLVFRDPIDATSAKTIADGLALTEWKRLTDPAKLTTVVDAAETQADMYAVGVLGGEELRRVRYVVVVSREQVAMPPDANRDSYIIRHINIAVRPKPPSRAAPSLIKGTK